ARHSAPPGRLQHDYLQHYPRIAHSRSITIRGSRFCWPVGEPDEERKAMSGANRDDDRPYDPRTKKPIGPLRQPGYYPDFSTLAQQKFWDAKTREVILERVHNIPPLRFFTSAEAR